MWNPEYDLRYLQAGLEGLESYLLSSSLYRPVGIAARKDETPYPQLTLGWMLLAVKRAEAGAKTASQSEEVEQARRELETYRSRWRAAWGGKAAHEFRARLNLWNDFLMEYQENPAAHYDRYGYEVGRRVLLDLLQPEAEKVPQAQYELLDSLDKYLRAVIVFGNFIWQPELMPGFPKDRFWYLYGNLRQEIG